MTDFFEDRLNSRRESRSEKVDDNSATHAARSSRRCDFMEPVYEYLSILREHGVVFPAGNIPPIDLLRQQAGQSVPHVIIAINTHCSVHIRVVGARIAAEGAFKYECYVKHLMSKTSELKTHSSIKVGLWLADIVAEYEIPTHTATRLVKKPSEDESVRTRSIDLD